jgi:phosphate uptake regulator
VEDLCTRLLDQARPKIPQVRPAVAALQVAQRLERAGQELGGLAEIVRSRRGRAFGDTALVSLADGVRARLTDAVEGFIAKDADRAQAVLAQQSNAEMHQRNLIESTLRRAAGDPRSIGSDLTLLAAARHLERMSGLAADIADATVREVSTRR